MIETSNFAETAENGVAIPEPPARLSAKERKYYDYVATALYENGLCHKTDGMLLMVIARTFHDWVEGVRELDAYKRKNDGSYMSVTPNGYEQPCPLFYVVGKLKRELLQWLPEACLTVPTFTKVKKVQQQSDANQADLFDVDPVDAYLATKPSSSICIQ